MQKHGDHRLVRFQLDYPLRELQEVYRTRRRVRPLSTPTRQTWDDVKQWIEYDWGAWLIDICRQIKDGQPERRRFSAMFPGEWGSFYMIFQRKGVKVWILGRRDGDLEHWEQSLPTAEVSTWGSDSSKTQGLNLKLSSRTEAEDFLETVGYYAGTVTQVGAT
jgi:hypothetical protein